MTSTPTVRCRRALAAAAPIPFSSTHLDFPRRSSGAPPARTHTVVAVDPLGRQPGTKTTKSTTTAVHLELVRWADQFGADRMWAVEDCRHLSRRPYVLGVIAPLKCQ